MAKIDRYTSRASALADDEPSDSFHRPAGVSPPLRAGRPMPMEDAEPGESFLRSRSRVPVRRGLLPQNRIARIAFVFALVVGLALVVMLALAVHDFLQHDPRFRIDTASSIQVLGNSEVTRGELLSVFGSDIGRNVFFIPLAERRTDLERLPWVEHATVMRLLPDQLRISVVERTPIAFVRHAKDIGLVDRNGVVLDMPPAIMAARHFSFPVVTGIEAGDPLSTRAARMKLYQRFVADLDSGGEKISEQLSEVDLSDPEDIKALMPEQGSDILAHLGEDKFLSRYKNYKAHLAEWRQQYPRLAAVDLRYEHQVVLEMEKGAGPVPGQVNGQPGSSAVPHAVAGPVPAAKAVRGHKRASAQSASRLRRASQTHGRPSMSER